MKISADDQSRAAFEYGLHILFDPLESDRDTAGETVGGHLRDSDADEVDIESVSKKARMLTLFALLHYGNISEQLFQVYYELCAPVKASEWMELFIGNSGNWNSYMFEDFLAELRKLSLVQDFARESDDSCHFSLHPLVSDCIKLRTDGQILQECILQVIMIVKNFLDTCYDGRGHFDLSLQAKQEVLLHMNACEENIREFLGSGNESQLGTGQLDCARERFASLYCSVGQYHKARDLYERVFENREKHLGPNHPSVLSSLAQLAVAFERQGKYETAEGMDRRVLAGREKMLGKEHPDTLTSVSNLAWTLESQGKYEAAEEMNRRALAGREKMLGKEHPDTLTSVSNLAWILERQGKYMAAEEMDRRALAGREKVLEKEHPDTLTSISNLAWVLQRQGEYKLAEKMDRQALAGREKVLGKEHPTTLMSVHNLGCSLLGRGKYKEAVEMNRRALQGWEKVLGNEHPHTLLSVDNFGAMFERQGKYEAAEEMYRRALAGREKVLGKEHPDTLTSAHNLAHALKRQASTRSVNNLDVVFEKYGKYGAVAQLQ
ncbi:hypothetical protein GP486_006002 [Trichoglossum hirsutum]|uniref:Kinesin light chain n=1 Tax=Trichoglossum hirsutum TaxID=265104 RepID=A0A9P8L881_9PEZI|nr:hypothetical protein GP486_006002 [Trichoglossum hirsutum]